MNPKKSSLALLAGKAAAGFAACAAVTAIAYAAVTFDPVSGVGFVGKGDLQTPWGWNDATLQAKAGGVRFYVESTSSTSYEYDCEWTTGPARNRTTHEVTHKRTDLTEVQTTVNSAARRNPQSKVTGFNLNGLGESVTLSTSGGTIPVVGADCLGNGTNGKVVEVRVLSSAAPAAGALYATHADAPGEPLLLWAPIAQ